MAELSVCFSLIGALATVGGKLYCLAQEANYAEGCLGDLVESIKNTEGQLETIQGYLSRAGLSSTQSSKFERQLRDTEVKTNKFVNSMDSVITSLNAKSTKKMKQKLKLVNGELEGLRYQIESIDRNLSTIRQELALDIALEERHERRAATAHVVEKLDIIETNTTDTDARRLRKQYKSYAQEFMMDDYSMPPPYSPEPPTTASAEVNVQPPSKYSQPPLKYPQPSLEHSNPSSMFSQQSPGYLQPSPVYSNSQPQSVYSPPSSVYSPPPTVLSRSESTYSQASTVYSRPDSIYSRPDSIYSRPDSIYSQSSLVYSPSSSIYSPPSSVYSPSSISSVHPQPPIAELPSWPANPSKAQTGYPDHNKTPVLPTRTTVSYTAVPSVEKAEKSPYMPPIPQKPKSYGSKKYYFDGPRIMPNDDPFDF
ncbi:hypothetical protein TWF730_000549 [Orbilia blumenaviensis]|uniref:Uncharacterized protein n=1 Tax=Orbilia blumenaviensis TaxID=1796055 RepID=A0AAV9VT19_9PEZI